MNVTSSEPSDQASATPASSIDPAPRAESPGVEAPAAGAEGAAGEAEASAPGDAAAHGAAEGDAADGDAADGDAAGSDAADGDAAEADGATPADGEKRKRKRRRKKKGAVAAAGPEGAAPAAEEAQGARPERDRRPARERGHRARPSTDQAPFHVGEDVFGKVTAVLDHAIMVDLSGKALAIFDRGEMAADDEVPSPGDRFVARVHTDGLRGGLVVLTRQPLREEDAKPRVEAAAREGTRVHGLITGVIRGGVEVDLDGLRAFAPASGMDLHPGTANLAASIGQRLEFEVVKYEGKGRDIVVSRRAMLEEEARARRQQALALLEVGQVHPGVVRSVMEWGVFVAIPAAAGIEGLIPPPEASHDPRAHLGDLFRVGEEIEVKVLEIDDRGKIWLSRKALQEDPWAEARARYAPGSRHTGKVTRVEPFGVFVEVEAGVEGLLHVLDAGLEKSASLEKAYPVGQEVPVVVGTFDARQKRLALHAAPPASRADEAPQKVARGQGVKVEITKAEPAGLVVRLLGVTGRSARGFIPAGQTGTARGTDLRKAFKPGSVLEAKILEVDPRRGEPKLSVKDFKVDEERRAHKEYRSKLAAEGGFGTLGDLLAAKLRGTPPA
ncbi:MAG: 30S ribosomal protein S1 [Polyangiaceae bacterium]|nr:30S ribosomal protein S1 [Polyangiaceae bacterium]